MELSTIFKADIATGLSSVVPTIIIGEQDNPEGNIYLSTKNHSKINTTIPRADYYRPILIDVPKIKESIDLETGKFKISNVSIKISNAKIDGERFSDTFKDKLLINEQIRIYWESQGATESHDIDGDSDKVLIFKGIIRRYTHDDSIVTLKAEDNTDVKFNKEVPIQKTGTTEDIPVSMRNKPIPIVYGHVDRAPTVMDSGGVLRADSSEDIALVTKGEGVYSGYGNSSYYSGHTLWEDFSGILEDADFHGVPPLTVSHDDATSYVPPITPYKVPAFDYMADVYKDEIQWQPVEGGIQLLGAPQVYEEEGDEPIEGAQKLIMCINSSKSSRVECFARQRGQDPADGDPFNDDSNEGWYNDNNFNNTINNKLADNDYTPFSIYDMIGHYPAWDWGHKYTEGMVFLNQGNRLNSSFIRVSISNEPNYDFIGMGKQNQIAIGGICLPRMSSNMADSNHLWYVTWGGDAVAVTGGITYRQAVQDNIMNGYNGTEGGGDASGLPLDYTSAWQQNNVCVSVGEDIEHSDYSTGQSGNHKWGELFHWPLFAELHPNYDYHGDTSKAFAIDWQPSDYWSYNGGEQSDSNDDAWYAQIINESNLNQAFFISFGTTHNLPNGLNNRPHWFPGCELHGNLSEIDLLNVVTLDNIYSLDYFLNVVGRRDANGEPLDNPIKIIADLAVYELGLNAELDADGNWSGDIDNISYQKALATTADLKYQFSINDSIDSRDLISKISYGTMCHPYFKNDGKLAFATYNDRCYYSAVEWDNSMSIKNKDIIRYSFELSKIENCYTKVNFSYYKNYSTEEYEKHFTKDAESAAIEYNNYSSEDDNILTYESDYIRNTSTAIFLTSRIYDFNKYQRLIFKATLPISYLSIEVGDTIRFDNLVNEMRAYGVDYTKCTLIEDGTNEHWRIPLFFVTSVNKNLDSITIEAHQIIQFPNWVITTWDSLFDTTGEYQLYDVQGWDERGLVESEVQYHPYEHVSPTSYSEMQVGKSAMISYWFDFDNENAEWTDWLDDEINFANDNMPFVLWGEGQTPPTIYPQKLIVLENSSAFNDPYMPETSWGYDTFDINSNLSGFDFLFDMSNFRVEIEGSWSEITAQVGEAVFDFSEYAFAPQGWSTWTASQKEGYTPISIEIYHGTGSEYNPPSWDYSSPAVYAYRWRTFWFGGDGYRWERVDTNYTSSLGSSSVIITERESIHWRGTSIKINNYSEKNIRYEPSVIIAHSTNISNSGTFDESIYQSSNGGGNQGPSAGDDDYILSGDFNGDGVRNIMDLVALINHVLAGEPYAQEGDMNQDGFMNILDVVVLMNMILEDS